MDPALQSASNRSALPPSRYWWPNTWYGGGGLEVFSRRRYYYPHLLGYGARIEFTEFFNKLTFDETSERGNALARAVKRHSQSSLGW